MEELPDPDADSAKQKFVELITNFAEGMSKCYPESSQITDTANKVGVVCSNHLGVSMIIDKWFKYMQTPLDPGVKYVAPVERILQKRDTTGKCPNKCLMYHAFKYGDVKVALDGSNPIEDYIDLKTTLEDPTFDQESRDAALKYVRSLNDCVYRCMSLELPYCPSREDIANEIKQYKKEVGRCIQDEGAAVAGADTITTHGDSGRLADAMNTALNTLANESENEAVGDPAIIADIRSTTTTRNWILEWHNAMSAPLPDGVGSGGNFYDACAAEKFNMLQYASRDTILARLNLAALINNPGAERSKRCQELVAHVNVVTQVHSNVPSQMRGKIEEAAERLAGQIMSGDLDIASLDLNQIGQDVLQGCDSDDLSSLAENIGSLLPAISKSVPPEFQQAGSMLQLL